MHTTTGKTIRAAVTRRKEQKLGGAPTARALRVLPSHPGHQEGAVKAKAGVRTTLEQFYSPPAPKRLDTKSSQKVPKLSQPG